MSDKTRITKNFFEGGEIEQEYNLETGEVTFSGKVKVDRSTKDGKRIFYYSLVDGVPVIAYFIERPAYRKVGAEKEEADELVKLHYGVNMDE